MPFKRRLRLAFAALDHPAWCEEALDAARAAAPGLIDPAAHAESGAAAPPDLILLLDRDCPAAIGTVPAAVRVRSCDLRVCADAAARRAALTACIEGIAGGLRLLDRQA
jgi:hypothetical protein